MVWTPSAQNAHAYQTQTTQRHNWQHVEVEFAWAKEQNQYSSFIAHLNDTPLATAHAQNVVHFANPQDYNPDQDIHNGFKHMYIFNWSEEQGQQPVVDVGEIWIEPH